ncbi:MAG: phosphogluconate dehydratase [Salinisphaeraceae bacterium]|nr:phosphogluconate dehydratase [Salinisphaeraceae bacterium]
MNRQERQQALQDVTHGIRERSRKARQRYLERLDEAAARPRGGMSCGNLAHVAAPLARGDRAAVLAQDRPNIGIVSAYNDMLSAHQPYARFPDLLRHAAREAGATAQFAGGVPAMCDGITQGRDGMQLSLASRDVIAMATAVALSHDVFDAVLLLGICDKIVPGLLIGALSFGHLPALGVPSGPMPSGPSNEDKAKTREAYARGDIGRDELLDMEARCYHSPGTCTFYGTANTNQVMMEAMGLHLPGAAFVPPNTPLRDALTDRAATQAARLARSGDKRLWLGQLVNEKSLVNAVVALLATGGSTNHSLHLPAIARAAGITLNWTDLNDLSAITPLLARIYPNGSADVNSFHAAGGTEQILAELADAGLLHTDVLSVTGETIDVSGQRPTLDNHGELLWSAGHHQPDDTVLRGHSAAFQAAGGLRLLEGNLGRAVVKVSAVAETHQQIHAPAIVFDTAEAVQTAFQAGMLDQDCVVVLRGQGPRANGMPELHRLITTLAVQQNKGVNIALLTDGRLSGASGKVLAAIHLYPEAAAGGPISRVRTGDAIIINARSGELSCQPANGEITRRESDWQPDPTDQYGTGRELFALFRNQAGDAEHGGSPLMPDADS